MEHGGCVLQLVERRDEHLHLGVLDGVDGVGEFADVKSATDRWRLQHVQRVAFAFARKAGGVCYRRTSRRQQSATGRGGGGYAVA
eukprot:scaffold71645_cov66-Phaeocystis_antarctica.AAC.7